MTDMIKVMVTGGAGFIGSAVIRHLLRQSNFQVLNVDSLTYAGNLASLAMVSNLPNYQFEQVDICDKKSIRTLFHEFQPDRVMHLAAESHVDRSIDDPSGFIKTNVVGTTIMLDAALEFWSGLNGAAKEYFRFHHVSTDEVFGDLAFDDSLFVEETPYAPSSPYSASKAAADHFVRAWGVTYGLPVVLSNCSNNYGPFHFPEKLIPLVILNALEEKPLPVYGKGENIRDWLYVEDHARALELVMSKGKPGESYNVGGNSERTNLQVVETICGVLDTLRPLKGTKRYGDLITFVADRPGHDRRYAIDARKIKDDLGFEPSIKFEEGIRQTVEWYLANEEWWRPLREEKYSGKRLGKK